MEWPQALVSRSLFERLFLVGKKLVKLFDQLQEFALIFFFRDETAKFFNAWRKLVIHLAAFNQSS
jgi:hypothetical protein